MAMPAQALRDSEQRLRLAESVAGVGHYEMAVEAVGFGRSEAPLVVPQGEDLRHF